MLRTLIELVPPFVAVLTLVLPGRTVSVPPVGVPGKMVLDQDQVADGLKKYHAEPDLGRKMALLQQLAISKDMRVAVVLGELLDDIRLCRLPVWTCGGPATKTCVVNELAAGLLFSYFLPREAEFKLSAVRAWWKKNQADLRRRAGRVP